jgi:hypothetical protein
MKRYWYVKYGHEMRIAHEHTAEAACRYCYGMVCVRMLVKDLGTRSPKYFSQKKKLELQQSKEGWFAPTVKNKLGVDI